MPSTYTVLQNEWDDSEALDYLREEPGILLSKREHGVFYVYKPLPHRAWRALQYLCEEWDYAYKLMPGFTGDTSWYLEVPQD